MYRRIRRGKFHIYEDLDAARTALVVIDMQNAFMEPGVFGDVYTTDELVNLLS